MDVKERIAYVRGLMEGSQTVQNDPSTRALWDNILTVCDGLADSVNELTGSQREVSEYVEAIDEDLSELEHDFYEIADEELAKQSDELYEDDNDDGIVRAECPRCGEEAFFEEAFLYDEHIEVSCPECGEILYRGGEHTVEFDDNHRTEEVFYTSSESVDYKDAQLSSDN